MSVMALGWAGRIFGSPWTRRLLVAGGIILTIVWFYNWAEGNGEQTIRTEVIETSSEELRRQITVLEQALRDASARAAASDELNRELERQVDAIIEAANADLDARDAVCVPADITQRLRELE